jgi:hypothetical protein
VRVVDLGKGQRQRAAAIAPRRVAAHALRQVQVSQRDIGDARIEQRAGQRLGAADHEPALGFLGHLAAAHMAVAHRDHGLAGLAPRLHPLPGLAIQLRHAGLVAVERFCLAGGEAWQIGRTQEGHRDAPGRDGAVAVLQRQDQPVQLGGRILVVRVAGAVSGSADRTDRAGVEQRQQRPGRLDPARRIVVARDHHDRQLRHPRARPGQEIVELALRGRRGVGVVEQVARDQQRIDLFGLQLLEQPVQEAGVFVAALVLVQRLPQVPVGGVQDLH